MPFVLNRLFSKIEIAGAVSAALLFSISVGAAPIVSQSLSELKISSSSTRYNLSARAVGGTISKFADILAAKNVSVALQDVLKKTIAVYNCASFAFHISESFVVCEVRKSKTAYTFDLKNSEVNSYPSP